MEITPNLTPNEFKDLVMRLYDEFDEVFHDAVVAFAHRVFDEFYGFNTHGEAHWHWPDFVWNGTEKVWLGRGKGSGANWSEKYDYADDLFHEKALDYIDRKAGKGPFFIYLNYTIPHKGFSVPEASREPYEELGWPKPPQERDYYRNDPDVLTAFAGMISHLDNYVGEIRAKLEEQGIAENTLIFFTSDNGHEMKNDFFNSNGEFRGMKRELYEGGIRMPTALAWPGVIEPGTVIEDSFAFWDVLPTLCEVAGSEPSGDIDGISFLPSLLGDEANQKHHDYLYWEFGEKNGPMQALRFGKWKAVRLWDIEGGKFQSLELYNIEVNPGEDDDVSSAYPEVVSQALAYLANVRTEHPEYPLELIKKHSNK